MMEDQRPKTREHIKQVGDLLNEIVLQLNLRAYDHDRSKLESPEREIFDEYTPKLRDTTYGSDEYNGYLKEMKVALDHHYANNRHHPEHFYPEVAHHNVINEIYAMNLIDIIEMLCDWKAATLRHADGDIIKSIEFNQGRFKYSDELKSIFLNTVRDLKW
jgi:hypothetical protein